MLLVWSCQYDSHQIISLFSVKALLHHFLKNVLILCLKLFKIKYYKFAFWGEPCATRLDADCVGVHNSSKWWTLKKSNATSGFILSLAHYLKSLHYDVLITIINLHFATIRLLDWQLNQGHFVKLSNTRLFRVTPTVDAMKRDKKSGLISTTESYLWIVATHIFIV